MDFKTSFEIVTHFRAAFVSSVLVTRAHVRLD